MLCMNRVYSKESGIPRWLARMEITGMKLLMITGKRSGINKDIVHKQQTLESGSSSIALQWGIWNPRSYKHPRNAYCQPTWRQCSSVGNKFTLLIATERRVVERVGGEQIICYGARLCRKPIGFIPWYWPYRCSQVKAKKKDGKQCKTEQNIKWS